VTTVDCQTHVFPPEYAELLLKNRGYVRTTRKEGGYRVSYGDVQSFALAPETYDPRRKLHEMDAAKIDVGVLSINIPGPEMLDPALAVEGSRLCNDYIAELVERHRDRFVGLAVVPWQDPSAALAEYERAVVQLGLRGVMLYSHLGGSPVDSPQFEPLYARAAADGIPLVIHPTVPTWAEVIKDHSMIPMVGLMVDTSIAMLRLILSGIMERLPELLVVHPHCGGVLPYLMPRVEEQTEVKRRGRDHISAPPGDTYRRVYFDLVSPSALAMDYVLRFSSAQRLLFGSDHPWVKIETILEHARALSLSPSDREAVMGGNACRLFRIG
jgi:predicted TIM-barrel fold metal-dependent hydrolase